MGDILKRSNLFIGEIKNVVLTCLRLETRSNIHYFWSFIMHSKSSSNFFCCPGALLLHFILREQDILSYEWFIHGGFFEKKHFFHSWDQKSGFILFTLRNTFQHLLLLKFHRALIIFINFFFGPGALLLRFTLREKDILFISVIHPRGIFWKEAIFPQMRPKKRF